MLSTSTVRPLRAWKMSPGLVARPLGIFSVRGVTVTTLIGRPSWAIARVLATTAAAPPMSARMRSMPALGFKLVPPVSNVIPLPTRARGAALASGAPWYWISTNLHGCSEPCATERNKFMFCSRAQSASCTTTLVWGTCLKASIIR